jgi:hypothetical protein
VRWRSATAATTLGRGPPHRAGVLARVDCGEDEDDDASSFLSGRRDTWAVLAPVTGMGLGCFWAFPVGLLRQVSPLLSLLYFLFYFFFLIFCFLKFCFEFQFELIIILQVLTM